MSAKTAVPCNREKIQQENKKKKRKKCAVQKSECNAFAASENFNCQWVLFRASPKHYVDTTKKFTNKVGGFFYLFWLKIVYILYLFPINFFILLKDPLLLL